MLSSRKLLGLFACAFAVTAFAQSKPAKPSSGTSASLKHYCRQGGGFCFSYPASWIMLGQYGDGVIVAPQQTLDRELWDEVTVTAAVPPAVEGEAVKSIDQIIEAAMGNMRASGHDPATLQRQERTVAGLPAQMIRIRYHDEPSGRDWIEQLVFVQGPEQEIYSIALKAQPGSIAKLEAAFERMVRSWRLQR